MSKSSQLLRRMPSAVLYGVRFRHEQQLAVALNGELDLSRTLAGDAAAGWVEGRIFDSGR